MRSILVLLGCAALAALMLAFPACHSDPVGTTSLDGAHPRAADSLDIWYGERMLDHTPRWLRYGG